MPPAPTLPRNDPRQYDELSAEWWRPRGAFAVLHWIAAARAGAIPPADVAGAILLDVACGGGLLAPHVAALGYRHVGVDLTMSALRLAREHGVTVVRGDAGRLPLRDGAADVVVAGEMLEHVPDLPRVVGELARVLRPGGMLVADTIADTALARFATITVGERLRGVPVGLHDSRLYVDRAQLLREARRHGIDLQLRGLRPALLDVAGWLLHRRPDVRLVPTRLTSVLFTAVGRRAMTAGL